MHLGKSKIAIKLECLPNLDKSDYEAKPRIRII